MSDLSLARSGLRLFLRSLGLCLTSLARGDLRAARIRLSQMRITARVIYKGLVRKVE